MTGQEPLRCQSPKCGAPIIFAVVANQAGRKPARMPLNPAPDKTGNVACHRDGAGTLIGRVLSKNDHPASHETLYTPHFATCKDPPHRHRQRKHEARRTSGGHKPRRPQPPTQTPLFT